jgi:iron complex outermembrane recepter protein
MEGAVVCSFGCFEAGPPPCATSGTTNINAENLHSNYSGFKSRRNLTWHITPDALVYLTYSQGFRPGAFNCSSSLKADGQFNTPIGYAPDTLTNKEIGWKAEFCNYRLQFNEALYQKNWNNVQFAFYDPGELGNLTFTTNGSDFRVR